jgi:hypothetical protein
VASYRLHTANARDTHTVPWLPRFASDRSLAPGVDAQQYTSNRHTTPSRSSKNHAYPAATHLCDIAQSPDLAELVQDAARQIPVALWRYAPIPQTP